VLSDAQTGTRYSSDFQDGHARYEETDDAQLARSSGQWRPLHCVLAGCAIMSVAAFVLAPAAAIGELLTSEDAAWKVGSEVLVGVNINPEGLEPTYEIQVECPDYPPCQATAGQLPAVDEARAVHLV
jgi:hypothetical protein